MKEFKANIQSTVSHFKIIFSPQLPAEFDEPSALVVLLEEELVVIDLQSAGWPTIPAPYLAPLHSSAITCSYHISNVPPKLWERVVSAGQQQSPLQTHMVSLVCTVCADLTAVQV